jgi:rhodanese-related sulfurtransferase
MGERLLRTYNQIFIGSMRRLIAGKFGMGRIGEEIDVDHLAHMQRAGSPHLIVDVREAAEVDICVIAGSLCIPMQQVPNQLLQLPRDRPIVVLCHHGVRSAFVTQYLRDRGFDNAVNLAGGIDAWSRLIEPDMPRY